MMSFADIYEIQNAYILVKNKESETITKILNKLGTYPKIHLKIIEDFYIHSQFKDYKTIEEYDKIIAPDKAAKLLSESLAPNLQDNEIIGMGLSYYPYFVGSTQTEPLKEDANTKEETELTHREIAPWMQPVSYDVFELTPFWTFYFDLDPSVIGLVDCKTGEVAYIHNVT